MANTAEVIHRSSRKELIKFLDYSRSSIAETISHAYVALDQNYISEQEMKSLRQSGDPTWKLINGMISYLRRSCRKNEANKTG